MGVAWIGVRAGAEHSPMRSGRNGRQRLLVPFLTDNEETSWASSARIPDLRSCPARTTAPSRTCAAAPRRRGPNRSGRLYPHGAPEQVVTKCRSISHGIRRPVQRRAKAGWSSSECSLGSYPRGRRFKSASRPLLGWRAGRRTPSGRVGAVCSRARQQVYELRRNAPWLNGRAADC